MRTTLNVDDDLLAKASKLTGIQEKTMLGKPGLESLIARKPAIRLARPGGTGKQLKKIPGRRVKL